MMTIQQQHVRQHSSLRIHDSHSSTGYPVLSTPRGLPYAIPADWTATCSYGSYDSASESRPHRRFGE